MFEKLPPKILVVESEEMIRTSICNTIERYWFSVVRAGNAVSAIAEINDNNPNVVIISSKLTPRAVLSLVKDVHKAMPNLDIPIIVLLEEKESKEEYSSIAGPLVEFIHRQFTPNELMLAIKALLRKSNPVFQDKVIKYKDLSMDLATYRVQRGTKQIHLGPTEFKIMQMLILSPRTILSREHIMEHVWGKGKNIEPRTVDVHVNRIRSLVKLRDDEPPLIKTVRSGGYCLNLPGERD
jgi:two-component system phosphate regulon response regulator PhoB